MDRGGSKAELSRAERIASLLEGVREQPESLMAARQCLSRLDDQAQRYLRLLAEQGVLDDNDAAAGLGLPEATANALADRVLAALTASIEE